MLQSHSMGLSGVCAAEGSVKKRLLRVGVSPGHSAYSVCQQLQEGVKELGFDVTSRQHSIMRYDDELRFGH